jgi:hypothetical protein
LAACSFASPHQAANFVWTKAIQQDGQWHTLHRVLHRVTSFVNRLQFLQFFFGAIDVS